MSALTSGLVVNVHRDKHERAFVAQVIESVGANQVEHFVYGRVKPGRKGNYIMVTQGTAHEVPDYIADAVYDEANRNVPIVKKIISKPEQSSFTVDVAFGKICISPNFDSAFYILLSKAKSKSTYYELVANGKKHNIYYDKLNIFPSEGSYYTCKDINTILEVSFSFYNIDVANSVAREVNKLQKDYLNEVIKSLKGDPK